MDYAPWIAVVLVAAPFVAEAALYFCDWCYRKADDHFREKYVRMIFENLDRLERISESSEELRRSA